MKGSDSLPANSHSCGEALWVPSGQRAGNGAEGSKGCKCCGMEQGKAKGKINAWPAWVPRQLYHLLRPCDSGGSSSET